MKIPGFNGACVADPDASWSHASGPFRLAPRMVLSPQTVADVSAAVRWAGAEGHVLTPRAAATGMPGGNLSRDCVLDLGPTSPFAWVGEIDVHAARVTVGPGAVANDLAHAAGAVGLRLPGLPSSADRCTIGGMVANNAAGARSFRHGAIAERVRGLTVVDASGDVHRLERGSAGSDPFASAARSGPVLGTPPSVTKNSSGYGLHRFADGGDSVDLLVGSEGSLGVIVDVTLDLIPLPKRRQTAVVASRSDEELLAWVAFARDHQLSTCEFIGPWLLDKAELAQDPAFADAARGATHLLILEAEGEDAEVTEAESAIRDFAAAMHATAVVASSPEQQEVLWGLRRRASPAIAAAAARGHRSMQFIEDCVVPPSNLGRYLRGVADLIAGVGFEAAVFGHAGDANVHINPLVPVHESDWIERVRTLLLGTVDLVKALGGTLAGEHGDGRVRAPFLGDIWGADSYSAFVALKAAADPEGILNPGVVVPMAGQDPLDGLTA